MRNLHHITVKPASWLVGVVLVAIACLTISAGIIDTQDIHQSTWKKTQYNFRIPTYFSDGTDYFYEDGPYSYVVYSHYDAEISYCSLIGAWACDDDEFPVRGSVISNHVAIKNITYKSKTGVFSGYTTDGRIYYLKKKRNIDVIGDDGTSVCHPSYLAIIYPKSRQTELDSVIKMISKW